MADEITVKPKSEPASTTPTTAANPEGVTISLGRRQIISICAAGLGVCFFLPWAYMWHTNVSGFDLQKINDQQKVLWLIPICCALTIFAGVTKRSQQIAGQLSGALPYLVAIYWYLRFNDKTALFHIVTYGGALSLAFGAALLVLSRKAK